MEKENEQDEHQELEQLEELEPIDQLDELDELDKLEKLELEQLDQLEEPELDQLELEQLDKIEEQGQEQETQQLAKQHQQHVELSAIKLPPSIPKLPQSTITSTQASNPLSIRSNSNSRLPFASRTKLPPTVPRAKVSATPKSLPPSALHSKPASRSLAKPLSSAASSSATVGPLSQPKTAATKKTTTSTRPLPSQICTSRQPKPPSKPSSTTPSKPVRPSTLTASKLASTTLTKPSFSRTSSVLSISRSDLLTNSELPKTPKTPKAAPRTPKTSKILSSSQTASIPPVEQSPQPSTKSSQAFREMLAQAKRGRTQPQSTSTSSDPNLPTNEPIKELDPWGLPPIKKVIEKAQRTGKLNASSRMLAKVPNEIYVNLLPHTSIFHPSNQPSIPNSSNEYSQPVVDLNFSTNYDQESSNAVAWYETVPLTHLNFSLNELKEIEEQFGGFEALIRCDLHCNQLQSLPPSFGLLVNLTSLDLSANQLVQFPIPIMSLVNLQDLNLSKNKLTQLWPLEWKPKLKTQLATALKPLNVRSLQDVSLEGDQSFNSVDQPSMMTESSFTREEFCDQFPSSPMKLQSNNDDQTDKEHNELLRRKNQQPLPSLKTLKLSSNKFTRSSLLGSNSVQLPINLIDLDLSKNPLGDGPIDIPTNLGNLKQLKKLNLSGCELQDEIFCVDLEGDYDELSDGEDNGFFKELNELDLSQNAIDSLGPLETFFEEHCNSFKHRGVYRRLDYHGLPPELVKIIGAGRPSNASELGSELKVMIGHNFLRQEAKRRRKLHATQSVITAQSQPTVVVPDGATAVYAESAQLEQAKRVNDKSDHEDFKQEEYANGDPSSIPTETMTTTTHSTQTKKTNSIEIMFCKHFNPATSTINLEGLQLSDLPDNQQVYDEIKLDEHLSTKVEIINLSKNQLTRIPIELMYSFNDTLTVLNVSRNQIINNLLNDLEEDSSIDMRLSQLTELNLSSNFITGSLKPIMSLIVKKLKCFKLKVIDLSLNRLENLDGLLDLLNLHQLVVDGSSLNSDDDVGKFKLERILLDGNHICQIDDLIKFATLTHLHFQHLFNPHELAVDGQSSIHSNLFIDQINLADNSIQQLPFILGFLPVNKLDLARNSFRFPNRNVYDRPGGNAYILTWLRDRFSSSSSSS